VVSVRNQEANPAASGHKQELKVSIAQPESGRSRPTDWGGVALGKRRAEVDTTGLGRKTTSLEIRFEASLDSEAAALR
jgi:hypothetical protein